MPVAVTGGAGWLGGLTAELLVDVLPPDEIVVVTRRPDKVSERLRGTKGVRIREADFDNPATLLQAFEGVERVLVVSTDPFNGSRVAQHTAAFDAACGAGAAHVVFTSMPRVDASHPSGAHALEYLETEEALKRSGLSWTILQNAPYAENLIMRAAPAVKSGELTSNAGDGLVAPISHLDCAAVAASVLTGAGHEEREYVVTGPQLFTQSQLAELFSEITGQPIRLVEMSRDGHRQRLGEDGVPPDYCRALANHLEAVRLGYFGDRTSVVEDLTGRAAEPLEELLVRYREEMLAGAG